VQFLIQPFHIFGLEGQYWMLIVVVLVAISLGFAWMTRDRA